MRQDPRQIGCFGAFRSALRRSALAGAQSRASTELQILQLRSICEARHSGVPAVGIRLSS